MNKARRNELCHCGSGRKFKKCCEAKTAARAQSRVLLIAVGAAMVAALAAGILSFNGSGSSGARVWDPVHGHYHDANGVEVP